MGEARSAVLQELERFVRRGMIQRSVPGPTERRVLYAADKEHPLWAAFTAIVEAMDRSD